MKKLLLLTATILLFSCNNYDGETKLVVKGKVTDSNNLAVTNKEIKFYATDESVQSFSWMSGNGIDLIGHAYTDSEGKYTMVFPKPDLGEMIAEINDDSNNLNRKRFIKIKVSNFNNYQLVLPDVKLYQKMELATLTVIPNQTNFNNELVSIDYIGEQYNEVEPLNLDDYFPEFYYYLTRIVKKNQLLTINYSVRNLTSGIISDFQQNLAITNLNEIDFILTY